MKILLIIFALTLLACSCTSQRTEPGTEELQEIGNCGNSECLQRVCEKYGGEWVDDAILNLGDKEYITHKCKKS